MKKISAKILITQLVILFMTLFIFPIKLKADEVSYPYFLYNVRHTYEEDNSYIHPFRHKYEFYIHANHEVTGRFIISITSTGSAHTWYCESGGEIYNNQIMDRSTGTVVFVTGQQYLKVTLMYLTDSAIDIMNVRSIQFSQTDLDGNIITTDQSLWSEVQKIEDHTFQLLGAVGFINDNLTDVRSKLQSVITLMQTTNTKLDTLITSATNILSKVTSIDTALQNIDKTIDTVSWKQTDFIKCQYSVDNGQTYNDLNTSVNVIGATQYGLIIRYSITGVEYKNYINYLNLNLRRLVTTTQSSDLVTKIVDISNNELKYYVTQSKMINIYLYDDNIPFQGYGSQDSNFIYIYLDKANYTTQNIMPKSYVLYEDDIEYWNLIGNFKKFEYYKNQLKDNKTIIEKLSELILGNNSTNNAVNKNDQSNQQFNQQQQQYDQIESTFQSSFTTDQQAVQQEFNNNVLSTFAATTLWFTQQLTALYNASGQFKILFTMPLLLGLALFFIGRGAKVMAENKSSERSPQTGKNH